MNRNKLTDESLVSIIVAAYNVGKYLEECINSILSQTYRNLEIIVVINGKSSDNTEEIAIRLKNNDERIHLVYNNENSFILDGRLLGVGAVTGEYFTFVDGDDCLYRDAIATLLKNMIFYDADMVIAGEKAFSHTIQDAGIQPITPHTTYNNSHDYFKRYVGLMDITFHGKFYKTSLYKNNSIEFIPGVSVGDDRFLHYQLAFYAHKIVITNDIVYAFRKNMSSITNTMTYQKYMSCYRVSMWLEHFFDSKGYTVNESFRLELRAVRYVDLYYILTLGGLKAFKDFPQDVPDLLYSSDFKEKEVTDYIKQWQLFYIVLKLFRINKYLGDFLGCRCLSVVRNIVKKCKKYQYEFKNALFSQKYT